MEQVVTQELICKTNGGQDLTIMDIKSESEMTDIY